MELDNTNLLAAAGQGLALCLGLIVAIGAQNAFVLRQGLRREHVGLVVIACSLADALLMGAGVAGMAQLIGERPVLARALAGVGALFLVGYGLRALWQARSADGLRPEETPRLSRGQALAQLAAFTLLNPHVYLDTLLLVGSIGAQQPGPAAQAAFVAGASLGSLLWFAALGYGARRLAPLFARPRAWQWLDGVIGVTMLGLAARVAPLAFR